MNKIKMTAKEKSVDLLNKFENNLSAWICVQEILQNIADETKSLEPIYVSYDYWKDVEKELLNRK